jgi:hypothetical protein
MKIATELAALRQMTVAQLRSRFAELFGSSPHTSNRVWLTRRIAWRFQALAEGDLSDRARRRAAELAIDADLRLLPPRSNQADAVVPMSLPTPRRADARIPCVGTVLTRRYKGAILQVRVLDHGFAFDGQVYRSLSAVARAITGSHCNGLFFFHLTGGAHR